MKGEIRYCPDCGRQLKLADIIEVPPTKPNVYIYWCDSCSQFVGIQGEEIKIWKGKKPTQWIN